jgi:hypothetical protein
MVIETKGNRYSIAETIKYVMHAETRGFSVFAKEIGVSRQLVHHWCKLIKEGALVMHPSNSNRCNRPGQGRKTTITPEVENTLLATFTELREAKLRVPRENVVNADETNIPFVPLSTTTLNVRGYKTISVRKPDSSQRATLMIGVSASCEKLPPFIIFPRKILAASRIDKFFYPEKCRACQRHCHWYVG